jgi:hypothetical protein
VTRVGEAYYDLEARDAGLVRALQSAEQKGTAAGRATGNAFNTNASAGLDKTAVAASRFGGTMDKVSGATGKFGGIMSNVGLGVLQGVGIAGFMGVSAAAGVMVSTLTGAVGAASDLQETVSKVGVVFGDSSEEILKWGENSAEAFGMSKNVALGAAANYGNLFVALGLAEEKSADMSTSLVELAGDLASFNNVDPTEALDALRSGLVGETEPLRRFGVNLNEATIAQKALELGLISSIKQGLTPAQKAQASYALILDQTKTAQGDFARTSSGLANQQRINAAKMENALADLGSAILPLANMIVPALAGALTGVVEGVTDIITGVGDWMDQNRALMDLLGTVAGVLINVLGAALSILATIAGDVAGTIGEAFNGIAQIIGSVASVIIGTIRNIVDIASQIPGPWQEAAADLRDTLNEMQADVDSWGQGTEESVRRSSSAATSAARHAFIDGKEDVAEGAKQGLTDPVETAAINAKTKAAEQARLTPGAMAKALLDARFDVDAATQSIVDAQETTLSRTKEIAALEGFLSGKALTDALHDARPEVRAQADAWKKEAEDRLFALRNGVRETAIQTGSNYADALALQKAKAGAAARVNADAAENEYIKASKAARTYGVNTGRTYADGINSQGSYLYNAVHKYLVHAASQMRALSPPREGPLHFMDVWARNLGRTYADEFESTADYFGRSVTNFLTTGARSLRGVPTKIDTQAIATVIGLGSRDSGRGEPTTGSWSTFNQNIGDVRVDVTLGTVPTDAAGARTLGRIIGEEVRLSLVRTSSSFGVTGE